MIWTIDHDKRTISPLFAGQKFEHREVGGEMVIGSIRLDEDGDLEIYKDTKYSSDVFVPKFWYVDEEEFNEYWRFMGWAYNEPVKLDLSRFPHKCPRCTMPAYVGACGGGDVDCTNADCPTRKR